MEFFQYSITAFFNYFLKMLIDCLFKTLSIGVNFIYMSH